MPDETPADVALGMAAKQHAMGQDHRRLAGALEAFEDVQQEGIVTILGRWDAVLEALIEVASRVQAAGPILVGERRIGDDVVEGLETAVRMLEVRRGECVGLPDLGFGTAVQHHVHARQSSSGVVHLLSVERKVQSGTILSLVMHLEQERTRATGGVIDGLRAAGGLLQSDYLGDDARDLGRSVELPLALA